MMSATTEPHSPDSPRVEFPMKELLQESELDEAKFIIMHEPTIESFIASLHPLGSLYEKATSRETIRKSFDHTVRVLKQNNIQVRTVRQILMEHAQTEMGRKSLEEFTFQFFEYIYDGNRDELSADEKQLISDEYKRQTLSALTINDLIDIILTRPKVILKKSPLNTPLSLSMVQQNPLGNLVFCRDQQIVTAKGVVEANLNSSQRMDETKVMRYCFEQMGLKILGEMPSHCKLEGGDFFPISKDLCLLSTGLRSNDEAAHYLMEKEWTGTRRFAIVKDLYDRNQQRMHLDTIFNIASKDMCVLLEECYGPEAKWRRMVDEYVLDTSKPEGSGNRYVLHRRDVEFSEYLKKEHFRVIKVHVQHQEEYLINFLNIGKDRIISVHQDLELILREHGYTGEVVTIPFEAIKAMYGAIRCCTFVSRRPSSELVHAT